MFVPGDQFLAAALNHNPGLIEYAMTRRVAIATPASLIAMLWAVANGWHQYEIAQNAEEIQRIGADMHQNLTDFIKAYATVEQRIRQTVDAFNRSVRVMEKQVLEPARGMAAMGVGNAAELKSVNEIARGPRQLPPVA
jgi:DNA recombination protein RmuC